MVDEDINEGVLAMCRRKETFQEVCKKTNRVRKLNWDDFFRNLRPKPPKFSDKVLNVMLKKKLFDELQEFCPNLMLNKYNIIEEVYKKYQEKKLFDNDKVDLTQYPYWYPQFIRDNYEKLFVKMHELREIFG